MPAPPKDDAFLSRWSRRKRTGPEEEIAVGESPAAPEPEKTPERTEEEWLAELGLPEPESMKADDDFSAFMQARVPDFLRRRALRVLWRSNPVLANLDGMVDYGEDFTDSATVVENLQTAYEVGKGIAAKWVKEDEDAPEAAEDRPDPPPVFEVAAKPEAGPEPEPVAAPALPEPPVPDADPLPAPRHMRFTFD